MDTINKPDQADQSHAEVGQNGNGKVSLWNKLFVLSCTIAVTMDPFFFYIPTIDKDNLCVAKDKRMRAAALIMRGITDAVLLVHLICLIYRQINPQPKQANTSDTSDEHPKNEPNFVTKWWTENIAEKVPWLSWPIIVDILCLLPLPQILVRLVSDSYRHTQYSIRQSKRGSSYSRKRNTINFFLLAQYMPRIYQIHLSSKKVTKSKGMVARGVFNFFLYILASHVLGAFWYFFSVETEVSCWNWACSHDSPDSEACMAQTACTQAILSIDHDSSLIRNYTMIDKYCDGYEEDKDNPFGLGLFTDSMKYYSTAKSVPFVHRLSYCFWWGLRNLSNFGTSLETSIYTWENVLSVLVCITGLLLFLYLLGNLQAFIGTKTTESVEKRKKIREKMPDVKTWIKTRYQMIDKDLLKEIIQNISKTKLEQGRELNLQNLFYFLPWQTRKALKLCIGMDMLNKVRPLAAMEVRVLAMMCEYLTPVTYKENQQLFAAGDPIDFVLFIIDGRVLAYSTEGRAEDCRTLGKGELSGNELLEGAFSSGTSGTTEDEFPKSIYRVVTHREVDAFVLKARDLKTVFSRCGQYWAFSNCANRQETPSTITKAIHYGFHNSRSGNPAVMPTGQY